MKRIFLTLLLCSLAEFSVALPQSVSSVAYPQEAYYLRDLRFYSAHTLYDILRQIPGVTIGWQPDGQSEIQLHGIDSRYLTILVNGQPLLGSAANNVLSSRLIPASIIERIEIDRNARADLYLGGAPAGTINVILQSAQGYDFVAAGGGGQNLSSRVAFATHLNQDLRLSGEQQLNRHEMQGDVRSDTVDGEWHAFQRNLNRNLLLSYNTRLQDQHPLHIYAMQLKSSEELRYDGTYPLNRISTLTTPDLSNADSERDTERLTQRLGADATFFTSHLAIKGWLLTEQFDRDTSLYQASPEDAQQTLQIDDSRYALGWQVQETVYEHHWQAGLSYEQKKRVHNSLSDTILTGSNERAGLPYEYDIKENLISGYLLDRWHLTRNTEFEAGMHVYSYEVSMDTHSGERDSGIATGTHWLPTVHLMHRFEPGKRLRLSVSQNTREPALTDRVPYEYQQDNLVWRGNNSLDAELISNFNIGYEQNFKRLGSPLSDRNSGIYVRAFQRIIRHAIYQNITISGDNDELIVLTPQNYGGNAILRGAEVDLEFYPGLEDMRIDMGGGMYRSEIQASEQLERGKNLPNQPRFMARIGFHHHPYPALQYGGRWHVQGSSKQLIPLEGRYTERETAAIQRLDLYAEYQWNSHWMSLLSINLTPGPPPWQQQQDIRQYKDVEPLWQVNLIGAF